MRITDDMARRILHYKCGDRFSSLQKANYGIIERRAYDRSTQERRDSARVRNVKQALEYLIAVCTKEP